MVQFFTPSFADCLNECQTDRGYSSVREMPAQVVYQTNSDLIASYEAMVKNPLVVADMTEKGLLWFKFKDNHPVFQLSCEGKLQVKWTDVSEKRTLHRLVKNLLIAKANEKLVIKPLRQQTWIQYPAPESFKLYWCDIESEYTLKDPEKPTNPDIQVDSDLLKKRIYPWAEKEKIERANVMKAVEDLRHQFRFFREPTVNEVALKSGCLNSEPLKLGLMFSHCKPESSQDARWIAERAINLAGWLSLKEKHELNPQLIALAQQAINNASMEVIERAQTILKNYPELVPKVDVTELKWPDETKAKWVEVFGYPPPEPQKWILWPASLGKNNPSLTFCPKS